MKKHIFTLAILLTLTGCATVGGNMVPPPGADTLSSSSLSSSDRAKLAQLVSTAKPTGTVDAGSFDFTSYNIFINDQGQPCRTYSVNAHHLFGNQVSKQVACRVNGNWVASNSSAE